jgi:hypothetical protein
VANIKPNPKYEAQWLKVRKTRVKKTGMTEFLKRIDVICREYSRDGIISKLSGDADWKRNEDRTLKGFADNTADFKRILDAHKADWTAAELSLLKSIDADLQAELSFWKGKPLSQQWMASRDAKSGKGGESTAAAQELARLLVLATPRIKALAVAQAGTRAALSQTEQALGKTQEASVYQNELKTLNKSFKALEDEIELNDKLAVALAKAMTKMAKPDTEATGTLKHLRDSIGPAQKVYIEAEEKLAQWTAAVQKFEGQWKQLKAEVLDRTLQAESGLAQSRKALDTLLTARKTMAFARGDHFDAKALKTFNILEKSLPAVGQRIEETLSVFVKYGLAVGRAFQDCVGVVLGGSCAAVDQAMKALPAQRQLVAGIERDLKDLRDFVQTWSGKLQQQRASTA